MEEASRDIAQKAQKLCREFGWSFESLSDAPLPVVLSKDSRIIEVHESIRTDPEAVSVTMRDTEQPSQYTKVDTHRKPETVAKQIRIHMNY
jgi:hypothetical protein